MTDAIQTRPLTASEKGEQDEQVWRAQRKIAAWEVERANRTLDKIRAIELRAAARRAG